jgi:hypothetical protein
MSRRFLLFPTVTLAAIAFSVTPALAWTDMGASESSVSAGASLGLSLKLDGAMGWPQGAGAASDAELSSAVNAMKAHTSTSVDAARQLTLDCARFRHRTEGHSHDSDGFELLGDGESLIGFLLDLLL